MWCLTISWWFAASDFGLPLEQRKPGNADWVSKLVRSYEGGRGQAPLCICFAATSEGWFRPWLRRPQCFLHGRTYYCSDGPDKGNKVALRKVKTACEIVREFTRTVQSITSQAGGYLPATLRHIAETTLRELKSYLPDGPLKAALVKALTMRAGAFLATDHVATNLPREHHGECDKLIAGASAGQLAKPLATVERAKLAGGKPALLLAQLSGKSA